MHDITINLDKTTVPVSRGAVQRFVDTLLEAAPALERLQDRDDEATAHAGRHLNLDTSDDIAGTGDDLSYQRVCAPNEPRIRMVTFFTESAVHATQEFSKVFWRSSIVASNLALQWMLKTDKMLAVSYEASVQALKETWRDVQHGMTVNPTNTQQQRVEQVVQETPIVTYHRIPVQKCSDGTQSVTIRFLCPVNQNHDQSSASILSYVCSRIYEEVRYGKNIDKRR